MLCVGSACGAARMKGCLYPCLCVFVLESTHTSASITVSVYTYALNMRCLLKSVFFCGFFFTFCACTCATVQARFSPLVQVLRDNMVATGAKEMEADLISQSLSTLMPDFQVCLECLSMYMCACRCVCKCVCVCVCLISRCVCRCTCVHEDVYVSVCVYKCVCCVLNTLRRHQGWCYSVMVP